MPLLLQSFLSAPAATRSRQANLSASRARLVARGAARRLSVVRTAASANAGGAQQSSSSTDAAAKASAASSTASSSDRRMGQAGGVADEAMAVLRGSGAPIKDDGAQHELDRLAVKIAEATAAQKEYSKFTQEQVDRIFKAVSAAALRHRVPLAKLAVQETGMGNVEDKIIKNTVAVEFIYDRYKDTKTCGVISEDAANGFMTVAEPVGVIAGVLPTTHPCAVAIYKCLCVLKTRNSIVFSPHPRSAQSAIAAVKVVSEAAEAAGAPKGLIQVIDKPSQALTQALMSAPGIQLILATGGPALVKAAYSSGHPSIGVGAGNVPAIIDSSADLQQAISSIMISKTFDNGLACSSEQTLVVCNDIYDATKAELVRRGCHFLNAAEAKKAADKIMVDGKLNTDIVGKDAEALGQLFGIAIPKGTKAIVAEVEKVGHDEPWSTEKISPLLGMYCARNYEHALELGASLVDFAGAGHTAALHVDAEKHPNKVTQFHSRINAGRMIVNSPSAMGAIGYWYNSGMNPGFTVGCGSWGNNSTTANVGPMELLNTKRVAIRQNVKEAIMVQPPLVFSSDGALDQGFHTAADGRSRAFIVTDGTSTAGVAKVSASLEAAGIKKANINVCNIAGGAVTIGGVTLGLTAMRDFKPDMIVAVGGEHAMYAAKTMNLLFQHNREKKQNVHDVKKEIDALSLPFLNINSRVHEKTRKLMGAKGPATCFITVPTSGCTGAEVTPYAVIAGDTKAGEPVQYITLWDETLAPDMTVLDMELDQGAPKLVSACAGMAAIANALEANVSAVATEMSQTKARKALKVLFSSLVNAVGGDKEARAKVHFASAQAGIAVGMAASGISTSLDNAARASLNTPVGLVSASLLPRIIAFNATDAPWKQPYLPQYKFPRAKAQYAEIATFLELPGVKEARNDDEKVQCLIRAVSALQKQLNIPATLSGAVGEGRKQEFMSKVETMAEQAFTDQSTNFNPHLPSMKELRELFMGAW